MLLRKKSKKEEYEQNIEYLRKKKQSLLDALEKNAEYEDRTNIQNLTLSTQAGLYKRLPLGWLGTVYCTRREEILPYITATLSTYELERVYEAQINEKCNALYNRLSDRVYLALICESIIQSDEGIRLLLRDPYRIVCSKPISSLSLESAKGYIGHLLIVRAVLSKDIILENTLEIENIKKLELSKFGKMSVSGNTERDYSFLAEAFKDRKKTLTTEESLEEILRLKDVMKAKGWHIIHNNYFIGNRYFFIKDDMQCELFCKKDIIEIIWETGVKWDKKDYEDMLKCEKEGITWDRNADPLKAENIKKALESNVFRGMFRFDDEFTAAYLCEAPCEDDV